MNKKSDPHEKLIAELFDDELSRGPIANFPRQAAAHARARHQLRRSLAVVGATMGVAVAVVFSTFRHSPLPPAQSIVPVKIAPAYEIISDDELLAEVHDRPILAVVRADGSREIAVLDSIQ